MVERRPLATVISHLVLILGVILVAFPLYITFVASTHTAQDIVQVPMPLLPGPHLVENYTAAMLGTSGSAASTAPVGRMMTVSLVMALVIALGKIAISLLSAFAIVYFRFPGRQFFLTVPDELVEAARVDGAGPLRFFKDVLLPLSTTSIAALFVIQFIYGWNQYLWPLQVTSSEDMYPVVMGIKRMISGGDAANDWNIVMATAILAMIPPALVVMLMQKWFVKGLVDTEK